MRMPRLPGRLLYENHSYSYDVEYAARHGNTAPVGIGLEYSRSRTPGATLFPQHIGDVIHRVYRGCDRLAWL